MKPRFLCCFGSIVMLLVSSIVSQNSRGASSPHLRLMPVPAQVTVGEGKMTIDQGFRVALTGYREPLLQRAVERFLQRLHQRTGMPLLPSNDETSSEPGQATLTIRCAGAGEEVQSVQADESYSLEITRGKAQLSAPSPIGVLRGLETFLQLVDLDDESFGVPAVKINDFPRFIWRGLLIDVCRHWEPIEVIKRNLEGMAALKMNVFHWHLSDDQGFRIESRVFPKLQGMGSDGEYFTQNQVKEVIAYARDRGIRVVPEFDMPGHMTAWFVGYPELASGAGPYQIERGWGIFDPTLDPTRKEVYKFLDSFLGEMARLFPDEFLHIGGDENNGKQWNANGEIQAFKKEHNLADNHALQGYFNQRLVEILARHGKKMVGWDEILDPDLPKNVIIQSWRGLSSLSVSTRMGFSGILSNGYYLDYQWSAAQHYQVDPLGPAASNLDAGQRARILGGEACMWGEFVTPENIDSRIWPRTAAIAERFWSAADVRDVRDMYRRMEFVSRDLDALGLTHRSNCTRMIQRLAGDHQTAPVQTLSDIIEPVKEYARLRVRKYTSFIPLNRLVDATSPESDTARQFGLQVDQLLAARTGAKPNFQAVRDQLKKWRDNDAQLKPIIADSFLLKEARPLSETVAAVAGAGIQALDYIESGKKAPEDWKSEQATVLERAQRPQAELLIMIIPAVRKLVDAAASK